MASRKKKTSGRKPSGSRKTSTGKNRSSSASSFPWEREVMLFVMLAISILIFISNLGKGGIVGNYFSSFFFGLFGILSYAFPVALFLIAAFLISNKGKKGSAAAYSGRAIMKTVSGILLFLFLCVFTHLITYGDEKIRPMKLYAECSADKEAAGSSAG